MVGLNLPASVLASLPPSPYPQTLLPLLLALSASPYTPTPHLQALTKPLCSLCFLLPAPNPATALSFLGDALLIATPADSTRFKLGMLSFAGAHIAYTARFLTSSNAAVDWRVFGAVVAAVGVGHGALEKWGLKEVGEMKGLVRAYAGVIAAMVGVASGTGGGARVLGAWAFLLSDVCVAWDCFGGGGERGRRAVRVGGWWLYFWAQMVLGTA